jgi:hypothetical protein
VSRPTFYTGLNVCFDVRGFHPVSLDIPVDSTDKTFVTGIGCSAFARHY